jgi:hypothetical protein
MKMIEMEEFKDTDMREAPSRRRSIYRLHLMKRQDEYSKNLCKLE